MMKPGDIWIGIVLLAILAGLFIPLFNHDHTEHGAVAVIEVNGEHYHTIALTDEAQEIEIKTDRGYNVLRISDGGIEMIEADCPDQLCLGFGHIHRNRESIVCLPNRVFVEVTGSMNEGVEWDAIVS